MVVLAFAIVYVVWGSTYFFIHKALSGFTPFMLGATRFTVAGLLMLGWCWYKGFAIFNWKAIGHASVTGLLLLFIDTGIVIWVEQFMTSGLVAIMAASAAIWFILLDKPKWKENFTSVPTVSGLFMGFLGVVMLFGEQIATAADEAQRSSNILGMLLLVLGAIAWTAGSLYSKYYGPREEERAKTPVWVSTAWQILIAGIAFTITAALNGEMAAFAWRDVPAEAWWSIAYLVVFGSIIAYSAYIWLLANRPATQVSTYAYVNPIVAVMLSYFLTEEVITSVQLTGLAIILISVLLINLSAYTKGSPDNKIKKRVRVKLKPSAPSRFAETASVERPDYCTNANNPRLT